MTTAIGKQMLFGPTPQTVRSIREPRINALVSAW